MSYSLKLARFDSDIEIGPDRVSVLEVGNRRLFTRIVESLRSELGQYAIEPYHLFCEGKSIAPKGKLLFLSDLPNLPLHDRAFEKALHSRYVANVEEGDEWNAEADKIREHALAIHEIIERCSVGMWGSYSFGLDWELSGYLRAFDFELDIEPDTTFLDRCIRFFGLCVDIGLEKPLVAINIKSFLSEEELNRLNEQAIFHGISLLELESWKDERVLRRENKTCLELEFCEDCIKESQPERPSNAAGICSNGFGAASF